LAGRGTLVYLPLFNLIKSLEKGRDLKGTVGSLKIDFDLIYFSFVRLYVTKENG
jgi:hypothetical protein